MQQYKKILGKVMMTAEGTYNSNKGYDPISLITDEETGKSYISRKEVPAGTQINNREYWQPVASSGIIDNGVIILNRKNGDGQVPIYDLKSAAEAVAIGDRKGGVILGFLGFNPETDTVPTWKLYQYNDVSPSNWTNIDYWLSMDYTNKYAGWFDNEKALYDSVPFPKVGMYAYVGNSASSVVVYRCYNDRVWQPTEDKAFSGVVNLADEEDITSKQNKLKFKDKEYNPAQYNGLGRIYLRKNIVDGKNILTQTMMQATNTIYIIQYDYDLQGETITIPENCTLDFQGGSFSNGTIVGNNTSIKFNNKHVLRNNVLIRGLFANDTDFSIFEDKDVVDIIQNMLDKFNYVKLSSGRFYISKTIIINNTKSCLCGTDKYTTQLIYNGSNIIDKMITVAKKTDEEYYKTSFITIKDLNLNGQGKVNIGIDNEGPSCLFDNLYITDFTNIGISSINSWCTHINKSIITYCNKGIYLNISHNTSIFECRIEANRIYDIEVITSAGVNIINNVLESGCKTNIYITHCRDLNIENNYFEGACTVLPSEIKCSYADGAYNSTNIHTHIFIGAYSDAENGKYLTISGDFGSHNININNNHLEGESSCSLACATNVKGLYINNNNLQRSSPVFILPYVYNTYVHNIEILNNTNNIDGDNIAPSIYILYPDIEYYIENDYSTQHISGKCIIDAPYKQINNNICEWNTVRTENKTQYKIKQFNSSIFEIELPAATPSDTSRIFGCKQKTLEEGLYCVEFNIKVNEIVDSEENAKLQFMLYNSSNVHYATKNMSLNLSNKYKNFKFYFNINAKYSSGFASTFIASKTRNSYSILNPKIYKVGNSVPSENYYLESCSPYQDKGDFDLFTKNIPLGTIAKHGNRTKICISHNSDLALYDSWAYVDYEKIKLV